MRFVSAMNQAAAAAGTGASSVTAAASATAKRSFVDAAAQALSGSPPFSSAIQVGLPAASSARTSGSAKAPAETATAPPALTNAVVAPGTIWRAYSAVKPSTTK